MFLFDKGCVAPPPCSCDGNSIRCNNIQLSHVPLFTKHHTHEEYLQVNLANNDISKIPAHAFKNLSTINARKISMFLSYNQITQIDPLAFGGIDGAIGYLRLEYNDLRQLPVALGHLTRLKTLDIRHNPITVLDGAVMSMIGRSLETFELSVYNFTTLAYDMKSFNSLKSLTLESVPFSRHNDFVVFCGLESTLSVLSMHNPKLTKISVTLQND